MTDIGQDGVGLSGGQRQRVGLARALFGKPSFVVLDEPDANLDGDGNRALVQAIERLRRDGKTVVIVTHRPNLLSAVDRMIILQDGRVAQMGPSGAVAAIARWPECSVDTAAACLGRRARRTAGSSRDISHAPRAAA
ncbi:ATP-binding cassette domain-containing protein [Mesorhizobium sp. M0959]|uniref:ATP-binding cassette domain-containing protein n=1 Tax=unclassified Mesorhizobium TaxID=325217 RepID=UPI0033392188